MLRIRNIMAVNIVKNCVNGGMKTRSFHVEHNIRHKDRLSLHQANLPRHALHNGIITFIFNNCRSNYCCAVSLFSWTLLCRLAYLNNTIIFINVIWLIDIHISLICGYLLRDNIVLSYGVYFNRQISDLTNISCSTPTFYIVYRMIYVSNDIFCPG